jgi:hypothetical protein
LTSLNSAAANRAGNRWRLDDITRSRIGTENAKNCHKILRQNGAELKEDSPMFFRDIFRPMSKPGRPGFGLADAADVSLMRGRTGPCELWTEYGMARIAEVKLQRPSPLATVPVQKARI